MRNITLLVLIMICLSSCRKEVYDIYEKQFSGFCVHRYTEVSYNQNVFTNREVSDTTYSSIKIKKMTLGYIKVDKFPYEYLGSQYNTSKSNILSYSKQTEAPARTNSPYILSFDLKNNIIHTNNSVGFTYIDFYDCFFKIE